MQNKKILFLTQAAMIAALYVVLTLIANAMGLANHAIQLRFSEALTILPYLTPAAIPGLFIGCLISNIFAGGVLLDIIFGSLATLIGALGTCALRKVVRHSDAAAKDSHHFQLRKILLTLPPIVANTIIVPLVLKYGYGIPSLLFNAFTVCIGEVISCGVLGLLLLYALEKRNIHLFD